MSTFVISLVVVGGTIGLVLAMVLGEETQPATSNRVRDRAEQAGRRVRAAGGETAVRLSSARATTVERAQAAREHRREERAAMASAGAGRPRRRAFVTYEPVGEVLDGPELPWTIRIRSGLGLATILALVGVGLALVIGLLAVGLAAAVESAVS